MILSDALILPVSLLQTQQLITPHIRSHIEYLTQTYNILVLILYSKLANPIGQFIIHQFSNYLVNDDSW